MYDYNDIIRHGVPVIYGKHKQVYMADPHCLEHTLEQIVNSKNLKTAFKRVSISNLEPCFMDSVPCVLTPVETEFGEICYKASEQTERILALDEQCKGLQITSSKVSKIINLVQQSVQNIRVLLSELDKYEHNKMYRMLWSLAIRVSRFTEETITHKPAELTCERAEMRERPQFETYMFAYPAIIRQFAQKNIRPDVTYDRVMRYICSAIAEHMRYHCANTDIRITGDAESISGEQVLHAIEVAMPELENTVRVIADVTHLQGRRMTDGVRLLSCCCDLIETAYRHRD